jgi:acyl-CoA synthetase (NDP forming)
VRAADYCTEIGLEVPALSEQTLSELVRLLPGWWVPGNPIDLVAGLDFTVIKPVMEILMKSGEVDAVVFLWIGAPKHEGPIDTSRGGIDISGVWNIMRGHFEEYSRELFDLMQELQVPLYVATSLTPEEIRGGASRLGEKKLLLYPSVESACRAIKAMASYYEFRASLANGNREYLTAVS